MIYRFYFGRLYTSQLFLFFLLCSFFLLFSILTTMYAYEVKFQNYLKDKEKQTFAFSFCYFSHFPPWGKLLLRELIYFNPCIDQHHSFKCLFTFSNLININIYLLYFHSIWSLIYLSLFWSWNTYILLVALLSFSYCCVLFFLHGETSEFMLFTKTL